MRIKKKDIIKESTVLDFSNEFDNVEKKILKYLKKKYGNPLENDNFNQWEIAATLIEDLNLPYEVAYSLTKTYFWNYGKLFADVSNTLRKKIPISYLFFENFSKLMEKYVKNDIPQHLGNIKINIDRDSGYDDIREIDIFNSYEGYMVYLGQTYEVRDLIGSGASNRRILKIRFKISPIGNREKTFYDLDDWDDVNSEEFKIESTYYFGSSSDESAPENFIEFTKPYPKTLTLESFTTIMNECIYYSLGKIKDYTFKLPSNIDGINVTNMD